MILHSHTFLISSPSNNSFSIISRGDADRLGISTARSTSRSARSEGSRDDAAHSLVIIHFLSGVREVDLPSKCRPSMIEHIDTGSESPCCGGGTSAPRIRVIPWRTFTRSISGSTIECLFSLTVCYFVSSRFSSHLYASSPNHRPIFSCAALRHVWTRELGAVPDVFEHRIGGD